MSLHGHHQLMVSTIMVVVAVPSVLVVTGTVVMGHSPHYSSSGSEEGGGGLAPHSGFSVFAVFKGNPGFSPRGEKHRKITKKQKNKTVGLCPTMPLNRGA